MTTGVGSESLGQSGAGRGETREQRGRATRGERRGCSEGREGGECGQEEIKHPVRYPSVPGLEFDQLRRVRGEGSATLRPQGSVVSALAGTHQGRDYKVNKNGGCLCLHR